MRTRTRTSRRPALAEVAVAAAIAAAIAAAGCGDDPEVDPPYDYVENFRELDCVIDGPLEVQFGEGEDEFVAVADGGTLLRHTGDSSQGPYIHVFGAFRATGVDAQASPQLAVALGIYARRDRADVEQCEGGAAFPWEGSGDGPDDCWTTLSAYEFLLGSTRPIDVDEQGVVEEHRLRLSMEDYSDTVPERASVVIRDQCGRRAVSWVDLSGLR